MIRYLIASLLISFSVTAETITTGNLLPNSGDGVDWGSSSTDQIHPDSGSGYVSNGSTINGFDITCSTSQSNCGYKYSVGGDFEVTGTAKVSVDDIALTNNSINQSMLDNGITLNSYVDVANCESTQGNCESKGGANDSHTTTVVLKDNSGNTLSTVSQTRTEVTGFQGNCNGYPNSSASGVTAGCGQYNDRIIYNDVGSNRVDWSWSGTDSNYTNQSRQGPNLLGASLTMTYNNTEYDPIDDSTQDVIDDIDDSIDDAIDDIIFEDDYTFDDSWYDEQYTWYEEDYSWEDDFYFEEEYDTSFDEGTSFEEFEMEEFDEIAFEEFEIEEFEMEDFETFEEMPVMEEVFFEEDFTETPIMEEIFEEEFEEEFADFLEETGMEEEFMEFLEEEGITAEEFFEEVIEESFEEESDFVEPTEEALDEEITDDNMEEPTEVMAEESETEESSFEVASNEEETMEDSPSNDGELEEDDGQVSEETNEESEPNSETSDESDISSTDEDEQEDVQPEEDKDIKGGDFKGKVDIAKFEKKLKKDIKKLVQQVKASTQNLSKEDIFFKSNNNLNAYIKTDFYKPKDIYTDQNLDLFNQIDLGVYNQDIYTTVTLASYVNNDPVEKHNRELQEIKTKKQKLLLELEALKNE